MTLDDKGSEIDVGEEAIRRLAGQIYDAPKDRTKDKERSVGDNINSDGNGSGKKKQQKQQGQNEDDNEKEKDKKPVYAQKYHDEDSLAEAIIVGRKPCFAVAAPNVGNPEKVSITLQDSIEIDDDTVLRPFELAAYVNKPYTFKSEQEFVEYVLKTKYENLDSIYKKVKSIWNKYIDADDFHISICTADTIFTYFQDKMGLTHYLFFVGDNSSGKSNNLTVLHYTAYRNMMSSGMTAANIYQFLGSGEEGIGTMCEDEADNIDEDHDKMRIDKNGYTTGIPVLRTDTSFGRKQFKYNTFCFKAFAAERLPDSVKAKGFRERTIELPCVYGFPMYDISEVVNPAGEEEYQQLLDELLETRNTMLVYRLLHFKDKIPDIKLNIHGREKQLFKPVLRVFQNTQTQNELLPVINKYISQRRESNANSLYAFLYELIKGLIKVQNAYKLGSNLIWNTIKETLQGKEMPYKPQSYDTVEFGIISQKEIIQALKDVFGANTSKKRHGNSRVLVFDKSKLDRLSKIYDLNIEVQLMTGSGSSHSPHLPHIGLDGHIEEQSDDREIATKHEQRHDNSKETDQENIKIISTDNCEDDQSSQQVAEAAYVADIVLAESSLTTAIEGQQGEQQMPDSVYRAYADTWKCHNCNTKGDRWFMIKHYCKDHLKSESGGIK